MSLGDAVVDVRADTTGFERDLSRSLSRVGKIAVVGGLAIPAITAAGSALSALTAGAVALTGSLGPPLTAAGVVAAGTLTSVGIAALSTKFAFDGVGEALKGTEGALADLTPQGQALVKTLQEIAPGWDKVKDAAQAATLPGVTFGIAQLAETYLPLLADTFTRVGDVVGHLAHEGAEMVTSGPWTKDFATLSESSAVTVESLGKAGLSLLDAFRSVLTVAAPVTEMFAAWVEGSAKSINAMTQAGRKSGELAAFFDRAADTAAQLGDIFGDLTVGLFNVFKIGTDSGGDLLDTFEDLAQRFRDFTESAKGENAIAEFFEQGRINLEAMGRLIYDIGAAMATLNGEDFFAGLVDQIRLDILPPLIELFDNMNNSGAIEAFVSAIGNLVQVLANLTEGGSAALGFAKALEAITSAILGVSNAVPFANDVLGVLLTFIGAKMALGAFGFSVSVAKMQASLNGYVTKMTGAKLVTERFQGAARLAQVGGLASLTVGLMGAADEGASFGDVMAGAAGGAGIGLMFGPIGALVGAAGGAGLTALAGAFGDTGDSARDAIPDVKALSDTFNELTGNVTGATRAMILSRLEEDGLVESLGAEGISRRLLIDAVAGEKKAREEIMGVYYANNEAIDGLITQRDAEEASLDSLADTVRAGSGFYTDAQKDQYDASMANIEALNGQIEAGEASNRTLLDNIGRVDGAAASQRALNQDLIDYKQLVNDNSLPRRIITEFEENGFPETARKLFELGRLQNLTKKEVKTLFTLGDYDFSFNRVKRFGEFVTKVDRQEARVNVGVDGADKAARDIKRVPDAAKRAAVDVGEARNSIVESVKKIGASAKVDAGRARNAIEDIGRAKPNLKPAVSDVEASMGNMKRTTAKGGKEAKENIEKPLKETKADFGPLLRGMNAQLTTAAGVARSKGVAIGQNLAQGIAQGIQASINQIAAAAAQAVNTAEAAARKAADTQSPSKVWAKVGEDLMAGLIKGIKDSEEDVSQAVKDIGTTMLEGLKSKREEIKDTLQGIVGEFRSTREGISQTFSGNLFDVQATPQSETESSFTSAVSASQAFLSGLFNKNYELIQLQTAFKKLQGYGLSPEFLSKLFASGNSALILELANAPKTEALAASRTFAEVESLGNSLGGAVARDVYSEVLSDQRELLKDANKLVKDEQALLRELIRISKENPKAFAAALNKAGNDAANGRAA